MTESLSFCLFGQYIVGLAILTLHSAFSSIPSSQISEEQCWRQYSIAVKSTKHLVERASQGIKRYQTRVTDEILVACVVFITIEILLGNIHTAARHIASGNDLFQAYLFDSHVKCTPHGSCDHSSVKCCSAIASISTVSPLDECAKSLLAVFSRMDIQLLSFLPKRYHTRRLTAMSQKDHIRYETLQLAQPFPNAPPVKLYQLLRRTLYWIHYFATPWKYSMDIPEELYATQKELFTCLHDWKQDYQQGKEHEFHWLTADEDPSPMVAHLMLLYHLTTLKLSTALCPTESVYSTLDSLRGFSSIICYAYVILKRRNSQLDPIYLPQGKEQSEHYFSLESSIVEALYYSVIKCRHSLIRKCALGLLMCAGREGVWDGTAMACCAEYVVNIEEGRTELDVDRPINCKDSAEVRRAKTIPNLPYCEAGKLAGELMHKIVLGEQVPDLSESDVPGVERLVNTVHVDIDKLSTKVEVECGWFAAEKREWRYEKKVLIYESCASTTR